MSCENALRAGKHKDRAIVHSFNSHHLKEEELESVGDLSKVCSQFALNFFLARHGRPDILRSLNKLARAVTKWRGACDRRSARLISYTHRTTDYGQYCHVGNTAQHCRLGLLQDSDFAGDFEDSQSTSERNSFSAVEHLFLYVGCARSKRQYLTVPQNQKLFPWMLVCEWTDSLLWICGMW